jgi:hypothetical protein
VQTDKKVGTYREQQQAKPEGENPTVNYDEITSHLDARYVARLTPAGESSSIPSLTVLTEQPTGCSFDQGTIRLFQLGNEEQAVLNATTRNTTLTGISRKKSSKKPPVSISIGKFLVIIFSTRN